MALASIFVGIISGFVTFVTALVLGQGFMAAAGLYVVGGFLAASAIVILSLARAAAANGNLPKAEALALQG